MGDKETQLPAEVEKPLNFPTSSTAHKGMELRKKAPCLYPSHRTVNCHEQQDNRPKN
jgi:hypothetical protein